MEKLTIEDLVKVGLGAMLVAKDRAEGMIDEAIKQGNLSKEEGENFLDKLKKEIEEKSSGAQKSIEAEIHAQLKNLGVATKEDIAALRHEITALRHTLEKK